MCFTYVHDERSSIRIATRHTCCYEHTRMLPASDIASISQQQHACPHTSIPITISTPCTALHDSKATRVHIFICLHVHMCIFICIYKYFCIQNWQKFEEAKQHIKHSHIIFAPLLSSNQFPLSIYQATLCIILLGIAVVGVSSFINST